MQICLYPLIGVFMELKNRIMLLLILSMKIVRWRELYNRLDRGRLGIQMEKEQISIMI
ncbi:Uncharacterised protein [Bacteroides thetaiotaomicron]|uniref:Uncharacterized protein n=1 Tax=Bacteroides thetaiotaomicron TaxID=818 RepID=A0A174LC73_BACT4|nr:Uncharacterised protein [Bacteroides thetaiotaomicron]